MQGTSGRVSGRGTEPCAGSSPSHSSFPCGCVLRPRRSHRVPSWPGRPHGLCVCPWHWLTVEKCFRPFCFPPGITPEDPTLFTVHSLSGEVRVLAAWPVKTDRHGAAERKKLPALQGLRGTGRGGGAGGRGGGAVGAVQDVPPCPPLPPPAALKLQDE